MYACVAEINPLKQGLKLQIPATEGIAEFHVAEINPLKQGLKPLDKDEAPTPMTGCRDKSTKTRIETIWKILIIVLGMALQR